VTRFKYFTDGSRKQPVDVYDTEFRPTQFALNIHGYKDESL